MPKTKPCPCCGSELELPTQYLDAVRKMRKNIEDYIPAIEASFKQHLIAKMEELHPDISKLIDENFWDLIV